MDNKDFILSISGIAVDSTIMTNLFPSVVIAQACLESSYGRSTLTTKYKNYFGIKGKGVFFNTPNDADKRSQFKIYPLAICSFWDHRQLLLNNSRYKKVIQSGTWKQQCIELGKSGYAESPIYGETLINLINTYDLYKYDNKILRLPYYAFLLAALLWLFKKLKK